MVETPSQFALSQQSRARTTPPQEERATLRAHARGSHEDAQRTASIAARAALEKKAEEVVLVDLRERSTYADFLVLCSGNSDRQLQAISDSVEGALRDAGQRLSGVEGATAGRWILLDFGDVVVHVFHQEERGHYDLEGLWADAPQIRVVSSAREEPAVSPSP